MNKEYDFADPSKAKTVLQWEPSISLTSISLTKLVKDMLVTDTAEMEVIKSFQLTFVLFYEPRPRAST